MIRLLTLFLLTLITFSLQAQKAKAKAQTEIVIKEVQVITKASADSLLEKQNEYLKTSVDQLDKAYSSGYSAINTIIALFGLIIAALASWGFYVVNRFRKEKNELIARFDAERVLLFNDVKNSADQLLTLYTNDLKKIQEQVNTAKSQIGTDNLKAQETLSKIDIASLFTAPLTSQDDSFINSSFYKLLLKKMYENISKSSQEVK